jgi:UPF0755 protein
MNLLACIKIIIDKCILFRAEDMDAIFSKIGKIWFTGFLYILAFFGYIFYGLLWGIRAMQRNYKVTLLILIALFIGVSAYFVYLFFPFQKPGQSITISIVPGASLKAVTRILEEQHVVPSDRALRYWIKYKGYEKRIQAGSYTFHQHDGIIATAEKLLHATPVQLSITIPEGMIIEEVAQRIAGIFPIDSASFATRCNDTAFIRSLGMRVTSLEGYLFPETYLFPPTANAEEIIKTMVDKFTEKYQSLTFDPAFDIKLTQHEFVTLASIVEKEATLGSERGRIAGVFYNRLRIREPLGADPTIRYLLRKFSGPLRVSELKTKSPYNTRISYGLPPGPICSPGFAVMQAVASPEKTKELYFVAKWDGSGAHDFSVTQAEHDRKKLEIRRKNSERINGQ